MSLCVHHMPDANIICLRMYKYKSVIALAALLSSTLGIFLISDVRKSEKEAFKLYKTETGHGIVMGPEPCVWEVTAPEKVISENKTFSVTINTKNISGTPCESLISLRAPGFDISPNKESQKVTLDMEKSGAISWILSPRKVGVYEIAVTDDINTETFGISVKNIMGLSAWQAQIAGGIGTLFGPMLTIPWWWDRFKKKKSES